MKRNLLQIVCLLLVLITVTGCSGQNKEVYEEYTSQQIGTSTATPIPQVIISTAQTESIMDQNPYEDIEWADGVDLSEAALAEEAESEEEAESYDAASYYATSADATYYPYAGASPIPLDPIDLPTPTPKPTLEFTYGEYTSTNVGVTFQAPIGWIMDETMSQMCILSEPQGQIKDGQLCKVTISVSTLNQNYKESELKTQVKDRLSVLSSSDFDSFTNSLTATRKMMGSTGVYANYSGTLTSGVKVGGRILYVSMNKKLYGLEIVYPYGYKGSFETVFGKIRSSMSLIK